MRLALDGIGAADSVGEPERAPAKPLPESTTETEQEEVLQAASLAGTLSPQPGLWQFTTQLVVVSKVNSADEFEISQQGIGSSEAHSLCVTPALAEDPGSIAFPFPPGRDHDGSDNHAIAPSDDLEDNRWLSGMKTRRMLKSIRQQCTKLALPLALCFGTAFSRLRIAPEDRFYPIEECA